MMHPTVQGESVVFLVRFWNTKYIHFVVLNDGNPNNAARVTNPVFARVVNDQVTITNFAFFSEC